MKKSLLLILVALMVNVAGIINADTVVTNTVNPKDLSAYDGQTVDLTLYRYIYKGWNTICLPVSLSETEINEIFGADCRLETLVGVENNGTATKLNFKDVKRDGLKARTPYILYSTQSSGVRTIQLKEANITVGDAELTFEDNTGTTVQFSGATEKQTTEGMYGIIAKDNATAAFVNASSVPQIYPSRCYIKLNGGELTQLLTSNHLEYDDVTGVEAAVAAAADAPVDVYNVSGVRIAKDVAPADLAKLPKGVYVVKGQKIWVK